MKLSEAKTGTQCRIVDTTATGRARARLDSLGLVAGENIHVLSSSFAGQIIQIKGSRLAICKAVADTLEIA